MKKYYRYLAYFLFWIFYFIVTRSIFLIYHHSLSATLTGSDIFNVFLYGLKMDVSFTSYLCIFPFLLFALNAAFIKLRVNKIIQIYTVILVLIISFVSTADLELYRAWGFRMDATPLQYLSSPREMIASASSSPVVGLLAIFILLSVLFVWLYKKFFSKYISIQPARSWLHLAVSLFLIAFLFVPIRGGIQKIPMNSSDVYFSRKMFANHAAINLPWNIMFSILNRHNTKNPFDYFTNGKDEQMVDSLYNTGPVRIPHILTTQRPNIIFIILESYTAKFMASLGGEKGVTPHIDSIAKDGLLFTNIYAAGDRSEKGQVAVLSGYPNQAITSIIKTPTKTQHLASITQILNKQGYYTSYTYGGELEFANIKSYLLNTGFDKLVSKYSFPESTRTTSWGVHDAIVLDTFFNDIRHQQQPFFATLFTLSSHEPFDVPYHKFGGSDVTAKFRNSVAYTDSCIGHFIRKLKNDSLWKNTLIVLVADHGHPLPGNDRDDLPSKFHIPLIFTGGALKVKGTIATIGSQTDIITTLLDQFSINRHAFKWGKDLLDSGAHSFAFYCFNNGFGFVTPHGVVTMDNVSHKIIYQQGNVDSSAITNGKAYMQFSYQDFLNR